MVRSSKHSKCPDPGYCCRPMAAVEISVALLFIGTLGSWDLLATKYASVKQAQAGALPAALRDAMASPAAHLTLIAELPVEPPMDSPWS